jgi:hypothetical protein
MGMREETKGLDNNIFLTYNLTDISCQSIQPINNLNILQTPSWTAYIFKYTLIRYREP